MSLDNTNQSAESRQEQSQSMSDAFSSATLADIQAMHYPDTSGGALPNVQLTDSQSDTANSSGDDAAYKEAKRRPLPLPRPVPIPPWGDEIPDNWG